MTQRSAILACIRSGLARVSQIERHTGIDRDVIRARLTELRRAGIIASFTIRLPLGPRGGRRRDRKWRIAEPVGRPEKRYAIR